MTHILYCRAICIAWVNCAGSQAPSSPDEQPMLVPPPNPILTALEPDWLSLCSVACNSPFPASYRLTPHHPWIMGSRAGVAASRIPGVSESSNLVGAEPSPRWMDWL